MWGADGAQVEPVNSGDDPLAYNSESSVLSTELLKLFPNLSVSPTPCIDLELPTTNPWRTGENSMGLLYSGGVCCWKSIFHPVPELLSSATSLQLSCAGGGSFPASVALFDLLASSPDNKVLLAIIFSTSYLAMSKLVTAFTPRNLIAAMS